MDPELMNLDILIDNAYENGEIEADESDALWEELYSVRANVRRIVRAIRLHLRRTT